MVDIMPVKLISEPNYYELVTEGSQSLEKFAAIMENPFMHFQVKAGGQAHVRFSF